MLIDEINKLKKSEIRKVIDGRVKEFMSIGRSGIERIFSELCFCILTANYSASGGIKIQKAVGSGFLTMNANELEEKLRQHGHRFPRTRALYIVEARKKISELEASLKSLDGEELRDWIANNIKGIGMKEASHFLRNIGRLDYAIIDFHIIDLLVREKIIKRPKTLTKKRYVEIESELRKIANKTGLRLGELDLYLWYMETGKVLK